MLKDCSIPPKNGGAPKYVVIFLHGLGSNGQLMKDHAGGMLSLMIPDAKIYFPDGPDAVNADPGAQPYRSWFEVVHKPQGHSLTEEDSKAISGHALKAVPQMNAYIDQVLKQEGITEDRLILAGFSQGASMAYYAALNRDKPVAAVYSLSGGALHWIVDQAKSKPPVLLSAGGNEHSDYSGNRHATRVHPILEKAGFETECILIPGKEHEISHESMELLARLAHIVMNRTPKPVANTNEPQAPKQAHRPPAP